MKTKIYSIVNKKGGVGKSTAESAIASICAYYGMKVLIVDLDPQINTTTMFYKEVPDKTITDILLAGQDITYELMCSVIKPTQFQNIDIIPGDENLDEEGDKILILNAYVNEHNRIETKKDAQMLLTKAFELVEDDYDLILIDNTPYFNLISKNALSASNGVLIPVQNDGFSYSGLTRLLQKIYDIKSELNRDLELIGIFFSNINSRTNVYKQLRELFKTDIGDKLLKTSISKDNAVIESNTAYIPLFYYSPKSKATLDYMFLVHELHILDDEKHKKLTEDLEHYLKAR